MHDIGTTVNVSDTCDANPSFALSLINMNEGDGSNTYDPEYDTTIGDGNTVADIDVDQDGGISLRAERSGTGIGRV